MILSDYFVRFYNETVKFPEEQKIAFLARMAAYLARTGLDAGGFSVYIVSVFKSTE